MTRILFVTSNLEYSGAAKQLVLLATGLPRTRFEVCFCVLGRAGPMSGPLRDAGISVVALGWSRWFDLKHFWNFRGSLADFAPQVIHASGLASLRAVLLLGRRRPPLLASSALPARTLSSIQCWLDQRFLRRVNFVVAGNAADAERYRALALPTEKLILIPPGVAIPEVGEQTEKPLYRSLNLHDDARLILCLGPLERDKGQYEAIWAFDILKYLYDNLHLVVVGDGPFRERLEQFVAAIECTGRVHFVGLQRDVGPLLSQADMAWVPSLTRGGVNAALEAMAAGRPVVASSRPELAEVVNDGTTGLLFPPGDKVALARQTRLLIDDPERGQRMGQAGRQRALSYFSVASLVKSYVGLYDKLASGAW